MRFSSSERGSKRLRCEPARLSTDGSSAPGVVTAPIQGRETMSLIVAALLLGMAGASINYVANRWAPRSLARVVLALSILPIAGLLIYCGVELGLAIETNDMRYLGADMAFGIVLIATF